MELNKFRQELQVRFLGSVSMVQAFLPQIRQAKGRIIWIMTPALIPTPYVSMIHACDFSLNCIARTLDIELNPWKIKNIMIRCGGIKTTAGLRTAADIEKLLENKVLINYNVICIKFFIFVKTIEIKNLRYMNDKSSLLG